VVDGEKPGVDSRDGGILHFQRPAVFFLCHAACANASDIEWTQTASP